MDIVSRSVIDFSLKVTARDTGFNRAPLQMEQTFSDMSFSNSFRRHSDFVWRYVRIARCTKPSNGLLKVPSHLTSALGLLPIHTCSNSLSPDPHSRICFWSSVRSFQGVSLSNPYAFSMFLNDFLLNTHLSVLIAPSLRVSSGSVMNRSGSNSLTTPSPVQCEQAP